MITLDISVQFLLRMTSFFDFSCVCFFLKKSDFLQAQAAVSK